MLSEDNFKLIPINKNPLLLLLHLQESIYLWNIYLYCYINIFFVSVLLTVDLQELIKDIHLIFYYHPKVHTNVTVL